MTKLTPPPLAANSQGRTTLVRQEMMRFNLDRLPDHFTVAYRDGFYAGIDAVVALLREPKFVEAWSRTTQSDIWEKIDENINDDDWNGGTARNLRHAALRDDAKALVALADLLEARRG